MARSLVTLGIAMLSCKGHGDAHDVAALTYFDNRAVEQFKDCAAPPCTKQVGNRSWTLKRSDLKNTESVWVPSVLGTNRFLLGAPVVQLIGQDTKAPATTSLASVARLEAGTSIDEYSTKDVPCVTHGTCMTTTTAVDGKILASNYSICFSPDGRSTNALDIDATQIRGAFDHQVGRLPKLATYAELSDQNRGGGGGTGWRVEAMTKAQFDDKMLTAVNTNIALRLDEFGPSSTTGCVNVMFVSRSSVTEALFKTYEGAATQKAKADQERRNSTVPH